MKKIIIFSLLLILFTGFNIFITNKTVKAVKMVDVPAGTTVDKNNKINLKYDIEMGKYEITTQEFIDFLNSIEVGEDGSYKAMFFRL